MTIARILDVGETWSIRRVSALRPGQACWSGYQRRFFVIPALVGGLSDEPAGRGR